MRIKWPIFMRWIWNQKLEHLCKVDLLVSLTISHVHGITISSIYFFHFLYSSPFLIRRVAYEARFELLNTLIFTKTPLAPSCFTRFECQCWIKAALTGVFSVMAITLASLVLVGRICQTAFSNIHPNSKHRDHQLNLQIHSSFVSHSHNICIHHALCP